MNNEYVVTIHAEISDIEGNLFGAKLSATFPTQEAADKFQADSRSPDVAAVIKEFFSSMFKNISEEDVRFISSEEYDEKYY